MTGQKNAQTGEDLGGKQTPAGQLISTPHITGNGAICQDTAGDNGQFPISADESAIETEILSYFDTLLELCQDDADMGREADRDKNKNALGGIVKEKMPLLSTPVRAGTVEKLQTAADARNNGAGAPGSAACVIVGVEPPARDDCAVVLEPQARELLDKMIAEQDTDKRLSLLDSFLGIVALMEHKADRERWVKEAKKETGYTLGVIRKGLRGKQAAARRTAAAAKKKRRSTGASGGSGKPERLTGEDYWRLMTTWQMAPRMNRCNDHIELDGVPLVDATMAEFRMRVRDYGIANEVIVGVSHAEDALVTLALQDSFHPIEDYLSALPAWDGVDHIGKLAGYFSGQETPGLTLARKFGHFLAGSCAKLYGGFQNPMLVLAGPQGNGKSFFARWLCPVQRAFYEGPIAPENKDCKLRLLDAWLWEVGELGSTMRKSDVDALKFFLTMDQVRERKPYGRYDLTKPSVTSFIGTVNAGGGFLVDMTGNRRFVVAPVETIDWAYAREVDLEQLWAQALHLYRQGDGWQLTREEQNARDVLNEAHRVPDTLEIYVEQCYQFDENSTGFIPTAEIVDAVAVESDMPKNRLTAMRVGAILQMWGCVPGRKWIGEKYPRGYTKIVQTDAETIFERKERRKREALEAKDEKANDALTDELYAGLDE